MLEKEVYDKYGRATRVGARQKLLGSATLVYSKYQIVRLNFVVDYHYSAYLHGVLSVFIPSAVVIPNHSFQLQTRKCETQLGAFNFKLL